MESYVRQMIANDDGQIFLLYFGKWVQVLGRGRDGGYRLAGEIWKQVGHHSLLFAGKNWQWCEELLERQAKEARKDFAVIFTVQATQEQRDSPWNSNLAGTNFELCSWKLYWENFTHTPWISLKSHFHPFALFFFMILCHSLVQSVIFSKKSN